LATVGASLVLLTVRSNSSETNADELSVAVNLTVMVPTSSFNGVPLNVRVPAVKVSQAGRALSSDKDAL